MAAGVSIKEFNDFVEATGPTYVTGPKRLINAASEHTYFFARLLDGRFANKRMIQGGTDIRESIFFRGNGTGEWYQPGSPGNWVNPQRLEKVRAYWRFCRVHMSWVEQEILLNDKVTGGDANTRFQQYVDIRNEKEAIMWTEKWKLLEDSCWRVPDKDTMEGEGSAFIHPYSLLAFVNEDPDGLFGKGNLANAWTTVEGVDPTAPEVAGNFTPQQQTYSSATGGDPKNIVAAFDDIWQDVGFEAPTMHRQYFEDPRFRTQIIVTGKRGRSIYSQLLRNAQDRFAVGAQDPAYPDPQFHGIPVMRSSAFEQGAFYSDGAGGLANEFGGTNKGPRYLWLNSRYLYPVFHRDRYFYKDEVSRHHNVPDTWVCPVSTYMNIICTDRRHQGIVSPSGSVYTA